MWTKGNANGRFVQWFVWVQDTIANAMLKGLAMLSVKCYVTKLSLHYMTYMLHLRLTA